MSSRYSQQLRWAQNGRNESRRSNPLNPLFVIVPGGFGNLDTCRLPRNINSRSIGLLCEIGWGMKSKLGGLPMHYCEPKWNSSEWPVATSWEIARIGTILRKLNCDFPAC
jgi:hypothetical protein